MPRNPPWEYDELLLALDVYFRFPEARQSKSHPEVAKLSKTLRALPLPIERPDPAKFRNINGTFLKLQNIKALDPTYTADGRVGMKAGATQREQALWDRFSANQDQLSDLADAIRGGAASGTLLQEPVEDEDGVVEGRLVWRWHLQRERAPGKAAAKKVNARKLRGELACEVCDLSETDTWARFGDLSGDVFECHHRKPLYTLTGTTSTRTADLAVVCPTCHRALHRLKLPLGVEDLRARVLGARHLEIPARGVVRPAARTGHP